MDESFAFFLRVAGVRVNVLSPPNYPSILSVMFLFLIVSLDVDRGDTTLQK